MEDSSLSSRSRPADWAKLAEQTGLSDKDVADITKRLDRMDTDSTVGPWTRRTLQLVSEQPGVVSTVLARQMGVERYAYKALVSKLKRLGLTYGLEVGYSITPRGRAFLRRTS
ncbi:MAG TPA: hypothetical protein VFA34_06420 [Actinomycetota bacterium]|jgi:hypothetical protein|nr:hypothetical protein [Actinomycetota bacterium]